MRLPQWLLRCRPRPTAAADRAFLRRWAVALAPLLGLTGLAAWVLPDSAFHATTPWGNLGMAVAIVFACLLPDDYTRLRRAGGIYLIGFVIYLLTHNLRWWALGQ